MNSIADTYLLKFEKVQGLTGWVGNWEPGNDSSEAGFRLFYSEERELPDIADDSDLSVLFQGFLLNRDEIVRDLRKAHLKNARDARIVLEAYSEWSEDILEKIQGTFLIAIWDRRRNVFLGIRDRCGIYPFFYTDTGSNFLFSTSIESLIHHPRVSAKLNRSAFVDFLSHRRPVPEETFYEEIKRIMPGHGIQFVNATRKIFRYWYSFPEDGQVEYFTGQNGNGFDGMLEKAVSRVMQLGNSGIFLSGGLDSVSIASVAALLSQRTGNTPPHCLSIHFPHPDCDEGQIQKAVAKELGLQLSIFRTEDLLQGRGLLRSALELSETWSQPMWNTWQPLYSHLGAKASELGCKVIMTGAGGDEWLNTSVELAADYLLRMDFRGLNRLLKTFMRSHKIAKPEFFRHILWRSGVRAILSDYTKRISGTVTPGLYRRYLRHRIKNMIPNWLVADPELKRLTNIRTDMLVSKFMRSTRLKGRYGFYSRTFSGYFIESNTSMEMEQFYEAATQTRVPVLHPYYDAELIHLLSRLSPEVLQTGGMERESFERLSLEDFPI